MDPSYTYDDGFQDGHSEGVGDLAQEIMAAATIGTDGSLCLPAGDLVAKIKAEAADADQADGESGMLNHYTCPECGEDWTDEWGCDVDDDCPACGKRHISPHKSEDIRPKPKARKPKAPPKPISPVVLLSVSSREFANIIAALRYFQSGADGDVSEILTGDDGEPYGLEMREEEIDALCERLNFGTDKVPVRIVLDQDEVLQVLSPAADSLAVEVVAIPHHDELKHYEPTDLFEYAGCTATRYSPAVYTDPCDPVGPDRPPAAPTEA